MPDDVTRVLNDHAVSMQALRNRQNMERQKIQARGKATPSTATSGQIYTGSKVATTQNSPPVTDNVQIVQQTFVSQVQFKPGMKNVSPLTPINKASGLPPIKKVGTATIIQMTENPRPESGKKRNRNKGKKGPRPGSASSIKSNTLSGGVNSNTDLDVSICLVCIIMQILDVGVIYLYVGMARVFLGSGWGGEVRWWVWRWQVVVVVVCVWGMDYYCLAWLGLALGYVDWGIRGWWGMGVGGGEVCGWVDGGWGWTWVVGWGVWGVWGMVEVVCDRGRGRG